MDDYNDSAEFDVPLEQRHRYFAQSTFTNTFGASTPTSNMFRRNAVRKLRKKPPSLACSIEEAQQMFPNSHKSSASSVSFGPEETQRLRPLPASRRMRSNFTFLAFTIILSAVALCRATQEQGFFSGQSLLRLESTINLHSRTTLSFMTCTPQGELLYQKRSVDAATSKKADVFKVEIVPPEQPSQTKIMPVSMMSSKLMMSPSTFATSSAAIGIVRLTWKVAGRATAQHIISNINVADGRGHLVDIHYKLGSLIFGVDTTQIIIANSTNNAELFDINLGPPNDGLVVGRGFTGCIQGGVSLSFEPQKRLEDNGVAWDRCSSSTMSFGCAAPLVDHCLSQPCRVGSLCRPQPTTNVAGARQLPYYCQCAARYTGQNCEIDQGPLCLKPENQCLNGGFCVEINFGNGTRCRCPPGFLGARCEESVKDFCKLHSAENAEPLCRNGGTCVQNAFNDGYTCKCAPGWTGAACEIEINECAAQQPCMHNGRCTDAVNGYQCDCTGTGYEGRNCEVNIDECAAHQQPCGAQGTCFDTLGNYTCSCPPGYEGQRCELDVDECVQLQQPCRNGGTCRDAVNNYECLCPTGFAGRTCEINVDDCAGIVCPDPGMICVDGVNNSTCECPKGTVRQQESTKNDAAVVVTKCRSISECIEKNIKCENGGKCVDIGAGGGYRCECLPGFTGPTCATTLFPSAAAATVADSRSALLDDVQLPQNNVCISGINGKPACKNNGTCLRDGTDKFQCVCRDGTTGQRCEINHNECEQNPCMNNATCEDLLGDFKCHCLPGWSGRWCHKVFDACEQAPCMNNGRCISSAPSSGPEYQCECPPGFTGKRCETQIDNCLGVACGDARHVCYNLANNYKCDCAPGWTGPDCAVRRNECERKPCRNGATCTENLNSSALANVISSASSNIGYTCTCSAGYTGRHCERDIDECLLPVSPCRNGAKCDNTPGSYRCFCVPGFIGNDCGQEVNLCLTRPCENGATCISRINGYECQCAKGFQGPTCALDVDECAALPTPCENGATCVNSFGGYNCTCAPGFEGQRCEINIDECAPRPCQHGGVCIDGIASFQCQCIGTGFTGTVCDEKINECVKREQPCQNGGTCVDAVNDYSCNCLPALEGKNCTVDIPECDLPPRGNPCQNGGTCLEHSKPDVFALLFPNETFSWNLAAGFTCVCPTGFTGQNCEINIDDCARAQTPCQHGSACIDLINEFECACKPGYEGYYCEQQIDMCRRYRSCRNGATCLNRVDGNNSVDYECQCPQGFAGRNCSIALTGCAVSSSSQELCEHGTCEPYLDYNAKSEVAQAYRCRCEAGYSGEICGKSSVLSFSGEQSFVKIEDVRLSRIVPSKLISFEFRTSVLSDGILAVLVLERRDGSPVNVQLGLHNGSLQLSLKIENQQQDVTQELPLAKFTVSDWTYVQVELLPERIQMIVSQNSSTNFTIKEQIVVADAGLSSNPTLSISRIWLGSAPLRFEQFIASNTPPHSASFIGCMRDVNVTAFTVALADIARQQHQKSSGSSSFGSAASNVRDLCVVQPRCATGDECGSRATPQRGTCVDMWTTHKCQCRRPYYGSECEFEYPAVTFGHDNRASKVVIAIPTAESRRGDSRNSSAALSSQLEYHSDVSFMFRTTETSAFLFYLGSFDRSSYVELHLINSTTLWLALTLANFDKLYVEPTWTASTGGVKLNDGELHTIRVVRDRNILRVLVDGDRLVIADTIPGIALHAQVLYVGNYAAAADNDGQMMAMASDNTFTISGKSVVDGGHHVAVRRFKRQSLSGQSLPLLSGQRASFSSNLFPTSSTTREPFGGETSNSPITPDAYFNTEDVTPSWSANGAASTTDSSLTTASSLLDLSTILPSIGVATLSPTLNGRSSLEMLYNDGAALAGRSGAATAIPPVADENFFKGVVQDFRLNDRLVLFAEPPNELLRSSTKAMPSSLALLRAQQPVENILPGVVSDDICKIRSADGALCLNGGECKTIPWNDYNCTCQPGFWGKRCELVEYCTTSANTDLKVRGASETVCGIRQATCRNLVDGFECSTTATFNGRDSQIVYEAQFQQRAVAEGAIHNVSLELRTREPRVEALVRFRLLDYYLDVGIDGGRIVVDYMLGNTGTRLVSEDVRVDDGAWHTVTVVVNDMSLQVYVNNTVLVGEARTIQKISLAALVMGASSNTAPTRNAVRNGLPSSSSPSSRPGLQIDLPVENIKRDPVASHPTIILGRNFLGCLRNARVGPYLLPFLSAALNSGSGSFDNPAPNKFALKSLVNVNIGACASSDACLTATDRCLHGKCIDTWNAYRCECDSGWAGKFCQHNLLGCDGGLRSYQQQPNEHYHYEQTAVVALDRLPCKNNATCQNTADGHVKCWCLPGFSGERCDSEIDECAASPCQNGALCEDHIDDFRCVCPPDFTGKLCNVLKSARCADQPCAASDRTLSCTHRNMTALRVAAETSAFALPRRQLPHFVCACADGTEGDTCDSDIRYCRSNPCKNAGVCYEKQQQILQQSLPATSTTRKSAQKTFPTATSSTTTNTPLEGVVNNYLIADSKYTCKCQAGWNGKHCELDVDECVVGLVGENSTTISPCDARHGKCVNEPGSYRCECETGYTGARCQKPDCSLVQCHNGGQCRVVNGDGNSGGGPMWKCDCSQSRFYGPLCNIERPCLAPFSVVETQCLNGGVCVDLEPTTSSAASNSNRTDFSPATNMKCECPYNYTGLRCEIEVDFCLRNPCVNGNCTRIQQFPGYRCDCYAGWTGISDCKVDIDFCNPSNHHLLGNEERRRLLLDSKTIVPPLVRKSRMLLLGENNLPILSTTTTTSSNIERLNRTLSARRPGAQRTGTPASDAEIYEKAVALPALLHQLRLNQNFNVYKRNNSFTRPASPSTSSVKVGSVSILRRSKRTSIQNGALAEFDSSLADRTKASVKSKSPAYLGMANIARETLNGAPVELPPQALQRIAETDSILEGFTSPSPSLLANRRSLVTLIDEDDSTAVIDVVAFCGEHGTCRDANLTFVCACRSGFKGVHCEQDVDECVESEVSPCQNGGNCFNLIGSYRCDCLHPFSGLTCAERTGINKLSIIFGVSVGVALVIVVVGLITFCCMAKKKRATRGTYSPSRQEMFGSRVEMNHVMRKPPQERLI